jgi:xanthine/CO dehydrogenase XdhC/CoxF family maturation factor
LIPVAGAQVVISTTSSIIAFHHWQKVIEVCERYLRENRFYVGEVVIGQQSQHANWAKPLRDHDAVL